MCLGADVDLNLITQLQVNCHAIQDIILLHFRIFIACILGLKRLLKFVISTFNIRLEFPYETCINPYKTV